MSEIAAQEPGGADAPAPPNVPGFDAPGAPVIDPPASYGEVSPKPPPPPDGGGGGPDGPVEEPPKPNGPPMPVDEPPGTGGAPTREPPAGPDDVDPPMNDPRVPGQPSRKDVN